MGEAELRRDYSELNAGSGGQFADPVSAAIFPEQRLRFWNSPWADRIGLGDFGSVQKRRHFARFQPLPGGQMELLAMRYHGHQFQHYNSDLGDGRGFLFAQLLDPQGVGARPARRLLDFGTKGSGQTPYSRAGDGRLTLKGAVREVLASEMLEALGVETSKTFSVFETGETLERHDEPSPTRSAVLTRLSHGHIRFGSFERLAHLGEPQLLRRLLEYSSQAYFPSLQENSNPALFFGEVVERAARLTAQWMMAGFVHGVLNTDNMNITGESFDYGPWRFLPTYQPGFTAAYFDHQGLYAYGRQPSSVYWNLGQLAVSLSTIADRNRLAPLLDAFPQLFERQVLHVFFRRLGLVYSDPVAAHQVFTVGMQLLAATQRPFETFFFDWYAGRLDRQARWRSHPSELTAWMVALGKCEAEASALGRLNDGYYRSDEPESMLIEEVEAIWSAIARDDNWGPLEAKVNRVRSRGKLHGYGA